MLKKHLVLTSLLPLKYSCRSTNTRLCQRPKHGMTRYDDTDDKNWGFCVWPFLCGDSVDQSKECVPDPSCEDTDDSLRYHQSNITQVQNVPKWHAGWIQRFNETTCCAPPATYQVLMSQKKQNCCLDLYHEEWGTTNIFNMHAAAADVPERTFKCLYQRYLGIVFLIHLEVVQPRT